MIGDEIWLRRGLPIALLLIIFLTAFAAAVIGIDYGPNGDEQKIVNSISQSFATGIFMPDWYQYPSGPYDLGVAGLAIYSAPYILRNTEAYANLDIDSLESKLRADLARLALSPDFRLFLRSIFSFISYLSLIWVFIAVARWQSNRFEAVTAAALLAGSWELNYHARNIAPDALVMQFGALTTMWVAFAMTAQNPRRERTYRLLAAAAAGLACGTKYPGGLFLLPIFASMAVRRERGGRLAFEIGGVVLVFAMVFLITTPGALLQPFEFLRGIFYEMNHYRTGHGPHTVNAGFEHFHLILGYLGFAALSKYTWLAAVLSAFAILGAITLLRRNWRGALVLLAFPVVYVLYMSMQRVMFIRNYQVALPFMAILAAHGLTASFRVIGARLAGRLPFSGAIPALMVVAIWVVNSAWLLSAANSIARPPQAQQNEEAMRYIGQHPSVRLFVSEGVAAALGRSWVEGQNNVTREFEDGEQAVFFAGELKSALAQTGRYIPINRFQYFTFLPPEAYMGNPNYFDLPSDLIVILDTGSLQALNIRLQ